MSEPLWKSLKVSDRVVMASMPPEFAEEGYHLDPETREVYEKLVAQCKIIRVKKVTDGVPWVRFRFRGEIGVHWLAINHGGIALAD